MARANTLSVSRLEQIQHIGIQLLRRWCRSAGSLSLGRPIPRQGTSSAGENVTTITANVRHSIQGKPWEITVQPILAFIDVESRVNIAYQRGDAHGMMYQPPFA